MNKIEIQAPVALQQIEGLRAGDMVEITGVIYTARDAAHRKLFQALEAGEALPLDLTQSVIYYAGPCPARPGEVIGSVGPTTSGRMDTYTPRLIEAGLRMMIGKGERNPLVQESIRQHGAVYLAAIGGAGALLAETVRACDTVAYPDLGPEAIYRLQVECFPAVVVLDAHGGNLYATGPANWRK